MGSQYWYAIPTRWVELEVRSMRWGQWLKLSWRATPSLQYESEMDLTFYFILTKLQLIMGQNAIGIKTIGSKATFCLDVFMFSSCRFVAKQRLPINFAWPSGKYPLLLSHCGDCVCFLVIVCRFECLPTHMIRCLSYSCSFSFPCCTHWFSFFNLKHVI